MSKVRNVYQQVITEFHFDSSKDKEKENHLGNLLLHRLYLIIALTITLVIITERDAPSVNLTITQHTPDHGKLY